MSEVRVIRPDRTATGRQQLDYFLGVSGETCGSTGIAMHLVVVPPGASAEPHYHDGYETASRSCGRSPSSVCSPSSRPAAAGVAAAIV